MSYHRTAQFAAMLLMMASGCRSTSIARHEPKIDKRPSSAVPTVAGNQDDSSATLVSSAQFDDANQLNDASQGSIEQVSANSASEYETSMPGNQGLAQKTMVLSIQSAIEAGLAQNPDLVSLRQAEGVGSAAVSVAQTYPFNPFVQVQATPYQNAQNAGPGTTYHYVLLMQQIQLGNQQQYREEAACANLNSVRWNVLQAELLNVAQTERLYFAAIYQQGLRDLARMNAENNHQLLDILERQKNAGQATAADVAIVRLDARSTGQQLKIAEANLQTAILDLKRHLCMPSDVCLILDKNVLNWNWHYTSATELTSMAANRPDVLAARADADVARANTSLANASRIPDVQLGPYYQRTDTGVTYLGFRGQMDLPVFNNGVPLLRQREAEYCQRATTSQQLATRARLEAEAAAERYERARQLRNQTDESLTTGVPIELKRLEEQFKANEVDVLRVLQARTSILQNQRADLDSLNELMQSAVAVTASTGAPLELLASPSEGVIDSRKTL